MAATAAEVKYRRVVNWNIDLTPASEYVSSGYGNIVPSTLEVISNYGESIFRDLAVTAAYGPSGCAPKSEPASATTAQALCSKVY